LSQNKQIGFNFLLAILRVGLGIASAPLLVRSVGLTSDLNFYYAATALTMALFSVAIRPVEIHYSPSIASALKPGKAEGLRQLTEEKIGAATLLLIVLIVILGVYQILSNLIVASKIGELQPWIYLICFVNSWNQYLFAQVIAIMRLEKRLISASYGSILSILASSLIPLLIIPYHGLMGYIILSMIFVALLNVLLFSCESLDIRRIISYKPGKAFIASYLRLIKVSIFTKGFAMAESVSISLFALKDSTLYFLAKKLATQFLSVFIEGRIRFLESDIAHATGNRDKPLAFLILRKTSKISSYVCLCYIGVLAISASNASTISHILKITLNQVQIVLCISAVLVVWLYSSVTGLVVSCAFDSLDLVIKYRLFMVVSATAWALVTLISTFLFGVYGCAASLGGYYIFNNTVITRKVALALS